MKRESSSTYRKPNSNSSVAKTVDYLSQPPNYPSWNSILFLTPSHTEGLYPYHIWRIQHLEPTEVSGRLQFCRWIHFKPHKIRIFFFLLTRPILPAMEPTIQAAPICGIVIIHKELSKATTNIAFQSASGMVPFVTNSLDRTFSRNIRRVIFTTIFCKMNCQHS